MRRDLGAPLFDVAMMAGELDGINVTADTQVLARFPLLAQGWALLSAHRVSLPLSVADLARTLVPSVWTMFNESGVRQIRTALDSGVVT